MNIADLKRLRAATGASIGECKDALQSCATFEEAEVKAREFVAKRELQEATQEAERFEQQHQGWEERQAAEAMEAFVKSMRTTCGLEPEEVEGLLEEERGNKERVRARGHEIKRERARQTMLTNDAALDASGWSFATSFRSGLSLCGSPRVIVGFESVQGVRVEFRLDLQAGMMDRLSGWSEHVLIPGHEPDDPEPLGVWWIISEDRRLHIAMQERWMDGLTMNDSEVDKADHPEVDALLGRLTNVVLRDLWIEK